MRKEIKGVIRNMELPEDMFEDILKKSSSRYVSYREDTGRLEILLKTNIHVIEPGEVGLDGYEWDPPVEDRDGNPIIQKFGPNKGEAMEPWPKVEVKCDVITCTGDRALEGEDKFFRLGGTNSGLLKAFVREMKNNDISNKDMKGTKWSIQGEKEQFWKYSVEYIGREDVSEDTTLPPAKPTKKVSGIEQDTLDALKAKKDQSSKAGLPKSDVLAYLAFIRKEKSEDIEKNLWPKLIEEKVIEVKNNKIYIL
jgi:hypothetical protein